MSDRGGVNFTISSNDQASRTIDSLKVKIQSLQYAIDNLNRSNMAGSATFAANLKKQLEEAEAQLKSFSAQFLNQFQNIESFNIRAIAAMRGQADAIRGTARALDERDRITRAGANGNRVYTQSIHDIMSAATGLGGKSSAELQQLNAHFKQLETESKKAATATRSAAQGTRAVGTAAQTASNDMRLLQRESRHVVAIFDELARNQRGQIVSTLGSMLRDSGAGTAGLIAGIGGITAAGAIFTVVEHLKTWNSEITKLAEKQTNFAAAVGMSVTEFSNFSVAMKLVGGNADTAARALESIQRRMEEAVQNPSSGPASAFLQLGLDWAELKKQLENPGGVENVLRHLAGEYTRLGNTAERTALFMQLTGGRAQLAQLVPILRDGTAGYDALKQKATETNRHFADNIEELTRMAGKIHELDAAWEDLKAHIVSSDLFGGQLENLTNIVKELNGVKEFDWGRLSPLIQLGRMFGVMQAPITSSRISNMLPSGTPGTTADIIRDRAANDAGFGVGGALQNRFHENLQSMISDAAQQGVYIGISSGFRSSERQAQLFAEAVAKYGSEAIARKHVAPPGHSMHNLDLAADLKFGPHGEEFAHANAARYGLTFPMGYEPRHIEPSGLRSGIAMAGRTGAGLPAVSQESPGLRPVPEFDIAAAEKLYVARLKLGEETARQLHQNEKLNELLRKQAEFASADPEAKNKILLGEVNLTKEQADRQTALLGVMHQQWTTAQQQRSEEEKIALARNQGLQIQARGREDAKELVKLAEQHKNIVASNPYTDEAQKIEAGNTVLQARINLEKQNLQTLERIISTQEQITNAVIKQAEAQNQSQVDARKMTQNAAFAADIAVVKEQYQLEVDLIQKEIELAQAKKDTTAETKAQLQLLRTLETEQTKITELQKKMADEIRKENEKAIAPLKSFFSSAGGAFESFFDAAIGRTETFKKALGQLVTSLTKDLVKGVGSVISDKIAESLGGKAGEGISGFLANKLGDMLGLTKAVPKATGDAALAASTTTVTTSLQTLNAAILQTAGMMGAHTTTIGANTTATAASTTIKGTDTVAQGLNTTGKAANTTAFVLDTGAVQTNAAAQAAGAGGGFFGGLLKAIPIIGGLFEKGGIVPSAAGGMLVGGGNIGGQIAILHPREMVLPAHLSSGIQSMIARGNVTSNSGGNTFNYNANVTGYHPYASRSSFENMLRQHGGAFKGWAEEMIRNRAIA